MSFVIPAGATEFLNPPVTDGAGYLSESELSGINSQIEDKYHVKVDTHSIVFFGKCRECM